MSSLTFIDIVAAIGIGFGLIRGFSNGIIKEVAGLVGVVVGLWAGFRLAWVFADYYKENFDVPETIIPFIAFLSAFGIALIGVLLLGKLLRTILEKSQLSFFDKAAGGIFGALKWAFIVGSFVGLIGKAQLVPQETRQKSLTYVPLIVYCEYVTDYSIGLVPAVRNTFAEMDEYFGQMSDAEPESPSTEPEATSPPASE